MAKTLVMTVTVLESGVVNYTIVGPTGNTTSGQFFPHQKRNVVTEMGSKFTNELEPLIEATKI